MTRKLLVLHYPNSLKLGFSRIKWIRLSHEIQAKDNDPRFRDEQRALYDALRDLLLGLFNLARISHIKLGA